MSEEPYNPKDFPELEVLDSYSYRNCYVKIFGNDNNSKVEIRDENGMFIFQYDANLSFHARIIARGFIDGYLAKRQEKFTDYKAKIQKEIERILA